MARTTTSTGFVVYALSLLAACATRSDDDETASSDGGVDHRDAGDAQLPPAEVGEICDGSAELRFAAYTVSQGNLDRALRDLQTVGWSYLYIDGQCHYWTVDDLMYRETREGDLTKAQARALAEDFGFGGWDGIEGVWSGGGGIHGTWMVVHDTRTGVACYFGCTAAPAPVQAVASRETLDHWIQLLYAEGTPLDGPIRMAFDRWGWEGTGFGDDFSIRPSPWPLQQKPSELAPWIYQQIYEGAWEYVGPVENPPGGHLITEPDALLGLREARTKKQTYDYPPWLGLGPAEGGYASIQLRDALPFEDADGRIPVPSLEARN